MAQVIKSVWRSIVPVSIRQSRLASWAKSKILPHNWIYDKEYYLRDVEAAARESAPGMVKTFISAFQPKKVVDLGSGTGALVAELKSQGLVAYGLEYSDAAIEIARNRGADVYKFNIETAKHLPEAALGADLAVSFEVAEHLPEHIADRFVELLTQISDSVLISAAPPSDGGGVDHVNEQPPEYWITKFEKQGFFFNPTKTNEIAEGLRTAKGVASFYSDNLLFFSKRR